MKAFRIIVGILMVLFGIVCIFTPLKTVFDINVLIAMLAVVYGVIGIIGSIVNKSFGIGFVFCILSVAFGIAVFFLPMLAAFSNIVAARLVAGWIVLQGVVSAITAIQAKKLGASWKWIIRLLLGVIGVMLGIFCFLHPVLFGILFAWTLGVMIGVFFVQTGFSVMFLSAKAQSAEAE